MKECDDQHATDAMQQHYLTLGTSEMRARLAAVIDIATAWALLQIKKMRDTAQPVLRRTVHILRPIKPPAEARALRAVYGPGQRWRAAYPPSCHMRCSHVVRMPQIAPRRNGRSTGAADMVEVDDGLACGGMGEVFLAEDPALRRGVALKRIRSDLGHDRTGLQLAVVLGQPALRSFGVLADLGEECCPSAALLFLPTLTRLAQRTRGTLSP